MTRCWRVYALFVCAIASAVVLALEILAARVLAPSLGAGTTVWAALLAVALGSLAIGNLLGGVLAARSKPQALIAAALCLGVVAITAAAWLHRPLVHACAGASLTLGSLLAAAILESPPMLLLGTIAPALIAAGSPRLTVGEFRSFSPVNEQPGPQIAGQQGGGRSQSDQLGPWAGWVLCIGSAGGIIGALAAGVWLIPAVGLTRTFIVLAWTLALAALPACLLPARPAAIALLAIASLAGIFRWSGAVRGTVFESRYAQLEVYRTISEKTLIADGLPQTSVPVGGFVPGDGWRHGYLLEVALSVCQPREALVLGLGGGLVPGILDTYGVHWHAVELDPAMVEIAHKHFGLELPPGSVTIGDGRRFLAETSAAYDLIVVDTCTADRLPMHLFTREALALMRDHLSPGGLLAFQFISDDAEFASALLATAQNVFPSAVVLKNAVPAPTPRWLLASLTPLPPAAPGAPFQVVANAPEGDVLTDDHFVAEHAWARTAMAWRCSYAAAP